MTFDEDEEQDEAWNDEDLEKDPDSKVVTAQHMFTRRIEMLTRQNQKERLLGNVMVTLK